ncbi:NAD(P)-binding protein [Corynespora cassiicola Philippines]|uniref:NAD(P)-binding protein n=1 Tax=Corynespora cassiicola Philippines TaxID=1448308 RepID=A0A2T2NZY0_CORCC|nr:NAD(P)-binding protein [Corynespora cassiicola Philippines]
MSRTIAIFGAGPGIGNHVATTFAAHGFTHIILLSRNASRLISDASALSSAHPSAKVSTLAIDLSDLPSIPGVLSQLDALAPQLDVVFFNAARIKPSGTLEVPLAEIEEDFKVTNLALYVVAQHYVPKLQGLAGKGGSGAARPALLVTNSHLPWDPVPQLLSLSLVKAAQANMVKSFYRAFGGEEGGVKIGLVHVEGVVAPENKRLNPVTIAEETWSFYEGGEGLELFVKEEA